VLVVDNGSFDGVLDDVRSRWPSVDTLQTGENLGFAGGMNRGLAWALERGAGHVTVLNNDTIVPPGAIEALVSRSGERSAVSPEVRYMDHPERVWFGAGTIDRALGLPRHMSEEEVARAFGTGPNHEPRSTEILAGCCITASAAVWSRVGGFDQRYFLNFEDSDWSVRATAAGVTLLVDPGVVIYHRVSASFVGAYTYLGLYYYTRNGLLFGRSRIHASPLAQLRFLRHRALTAVITALRQRHGVEACRRCVVVLIAVLANAGRRYGRAPRFLERHARSWTR